MSFPLEAITLGNAPQHFFSHLVTMPAWHKSVLFLAVVLGIIGGTGWAANKAALPPKSTGPAAVPNSSAAKPSGSSGFVGDSSTNAPVPATPATPGDITDSGGMFAKLSPQAMRIGISVLAGFMLGWIFRAFIKMMTLLAIVVVALFAALSYFGVLNVDLTHAKAEYATAMHWFTDQFSRLKEVVVAHLPSSTGGTLGTYLGLRRR